ncbi:hypothetical protein [Olivibacter sp. XZL3]|uniref:hypothetical protein n=1 Tax=Olivibacter sp. XZL3 TaxID=1735116 RepID=UPI001064F0B6|nr:hypothetical protein [Olivibacter sp. XZL3]
MATIKNDGHHSEAYNNDLSTRTTNHIHLHPGHHTGEFENWMRKIGGLLQTGSEAANLKPLLDLIVALVEPERIFLYTFPEIVENQIKSYTEILLLVDTRRKNQVDELKGFIKLACYKHHDVMITLRTGSDDTHPTTDDITGYEVLHCREEFLIFSNSPYRLSTYTKEQVHESYNNVLDLFDVHYEKAIKGFETAKLLWAQNQIYQAYVFLICVMEQVYNAIAYAFDPLYTYYVGTPLSSLQAKASTYLPQLFYRHNTDKFVKLSAYLYDRERFVEDHLVNSFKDGFQIVEEFLPLVKRCFESKLNYLLKYEK